MRKIYRINWLTGFMIGMMCIAVLTACGGGSSNSGKVATAAPVAPQVTTAPKATVAPQNVHPTATPVPAQPTSAVTTEPTATAAPVATATSASPAKSNTSSAALDQVLEQLFNANNSADQLNDVPQLK